MQLKFTMQEIHRKPDVAVVDELGVTTKNKCYTLVVTTDGKLEYDPKTGRFLIHGCGQALVDGLDIGSVITLNGS